MKKFHILLVDDNQHFLKALEFMLRDSISERILSIHKVTNGEECLNFLNKNTADLIFMDMDMPVMNGVQVTKIIVDKYRFINIIAISLHREMRAIRDMIEAGARNYIVKEDLSRETINRIFNSL